MATKIELNEESTHEDIAAAVEQLAAAEEPESKPEPKPSAQRTDAEIHSDIATNLDETPDGDDTEDAAAESESGGEKAGKKSSDADWLDDELKAETAAYGISEDELAEFTSREELERAIRFLDRSIVDAGRKAKGEPKQVDKPAEKPEEKPNSQADSTYEIKLTKDLYDDGLVDELTRMRDHYESRLSAMESRFQELDARSREQEFDTLIDSLEMSDLFGKTGKESDKELGRRKQIVDHVRVLLSGMEAHGRPAEASEALFRIAARSVFADELDKKIIKNHTRRISKQSNGRLGGGATRPSDPPEDPREYADRLYKEMAQA